MRSVCLALVAACHTPSATPQPPTPPPTTTPPPTSPLASPVEAGSCGHQQTFVLGPPIDYPPPPGASGALAVGFLDKETPVDLIVGGLDERGVATIGVMLGNGDATFKPPIAYELLPGAQARSLALTDFDTDEDLDVVSAGGSGTPEIFLNNGDGTFGAAIALPAPPSPEVGASAITVRVADIHGDAHPDVVTYAGGNFNVWHDSGHATFAASTLPAIEHLERGAGLALADFDRNGASDIAVAGTDGGKPTVVVLLGKRGTFAAPARYLAGMTQGDAVGIVAADIDGDGTLDLAALFVSADGGELDVLHGNGDGTFVPLAGERVVGAGAVLGGSLAAADLDGDGRADIVATTRDGLVIVRATASGVLASPVVIPATGLVQVAAGDLRGDHALGVVVTRADGHASVWPGACR